MAAPQIYDLLTTPIGGDGSADLAAFDEVAVELGTHFFEARGNPRAWPSRALDDVRTHDSVQGALE